MGPMMCAPDGKRIVAGALRTRPQQVRTTILLLNFLTSCAQAAGAIADCEPHHKAVSGEVRLDIWQPGTNPTVRVVAIC
jgi:hypothetical protein